MIAASRKFEIDAGHRVTGHGGKCQYLHGHRYRIEVSVAVAHSATLGHRTLRDLDALGMVLDFSALKEQVGGWLDQHWDHQLLLNSADPDVEALRQINADRVFVLPENPTAEYLAFYLGTFVLPRLFDAARLTPQGVVVWETPNCWAEWLP